MEVLLATALDYRGCAWLTVGTFSSHPAYPKQKNDKVREGDRRPYMRISALGQGINDLQIV